MVAASNMQPATARNPMVSLCVVRRRGLFVIDTSAMLPLSQVWRSIIFRLNDVRLLRFLPLVLAGRAKNLAFVLPIGRHRAFDAHAAVFAGKQRHQVAMGEQFGSKAHTQRF